MANPNNITLRSEKGSFLTFEEMDLNLTEVQNLINEYNSFIGSTYTNHVTDFNDLKTAYDQYVIDTNNRLDITEQDVVDINNDQTVQDNRISQVESDILTLQLGGGLIFQGNWALVDAPYSTGDVVTYTDGLDYISVANNNTQEPVSGEKTNSWIVLNAKSIAEFIVYSNVVSGLNATNVQDAIDEISARSISDFDSIKWTPINSSQNLTTNTYYMINFNSGPLTLTLPGSPNTNDFIQFYVSSGSSVDSVISRNGSTIMGLSENLNIDFNIKGLHMVYNGSDWRILQ